MGFDLTEIPTLGLEVALIITAELVHDLSSFSTAGRFCSWLRLASGNSDQREQKVIHLQEVFRGQSGRSVAVQMRLFDTP